MDHFGIASDSLGMGNAKGDEGGVISTSPCRRKVRSPWHGAKQSRARIIIFLQVAGGESERAVFQPDRFCLLPWPALSDSSRPTQADPVLLHRRPAMVSYTGQW